MLSGKSRYFSLAISSIMLLLGLVATSLPTGAQAEPRNQKVDQLVGYLRSVICFRLPQVHDVGHLISHGGSPKDPLSTKIDRAISSRCRGRRERWQRVTYRPRRQSRIANHSPRSHAAVEVFFDPEVASLTSPSTSSSKIWKPATPPRRWWPAGHAIKLTVTKPASRCRTRGLEADAPQAHSRQVYDRRVQAVQGRMVWSN